jgi:hypothetical protein
MKSAIWFASVFSCGLFVSAAFAAPAPYSQPVKYMEASFDCEESRPVLNQYAINIGFQSAEVRLPDLRPQLQINGSRLELVGVNAERTVVVGVITSTPTCDTSDSSYTRASWNAIQINPQVQVTASVTPTPELCSPLLHAGYSYGRNDRFQLRIESAYQNEPQVFSWTVQRVFSTLEECQNSN